MSDVVELADIFREYGPTYRSKYGSRMLPSHLAAMRAIEQCRTEALGGHLYYCADCDESWYSYHSCRNRHCPKCQQDAAQAWLEKQQDLLLPVPYFLVTFTLPQPLRSLARTQQKTVYNLLFRSAAQSLQQLALDPRFVGGQIGMVGILQTWTRDLRYHPHIHFLVPGGGLSTDGQHWLRAKNHFFVHVKPLSRLFRGKMRDGLRKQGLLAQVPDETWRQDWVVDCRPVGTGETALKYLTPYVFRVALSNKRILKAQDGQVTFRYQDGETKQQRRCTLSAEAFIQRFLQHVLPKGFVKVRYYGLLAPGNRKRLAQVKRLLGKRTDECNDPQSTDADDTEGCTTVTCPHCGQPMTVVQRIQPRARCPP
jgi:hypothetical protein